MKVGFKPRVERQYVGSYRPRIDGWEKASGRAEFLDDLARGARFPGMLHARVLRSPHPHARILSMDTSKAVQLPGVYAILRYDDPEVMALKPTTHAWTSFNTASYDKMYWPRYRDRRVLGDHACWVGDELGAVVAAETVEIAEQALSLIEVEWEELPFVLDKYEAMQPGAPILHPEINPEGNVLPAEPLCGPDVFVDRGDVDAMFSEADLTVEVSATYHNADHSCLDTRGCLAMWDGDQLTVWTNYYQADQTRMHISQMLDLPLYSVRVICPYAGASMGRGNQGDQIFFIFTSILARRTRRPVRFKYTRREDFHDTRNSITWSCKLATQSDGSIRGAYFKGLGDAGAYADHSMAALKYMTGFEISECLLAHIPNLRMEAYAVYTNKIPASCMRGIGNNQFNFALGLAVDSLAERLGMDPLDLALKNFGQQWHPLPDRSLEACLRQGARRVGWSKRHRPGRGQTYDGSKKRGMGFSCHMGWHTAWEEQGRGHVQLGIKLNPDMTVILQAPMVETGPGSNSCAVFACAEALAFLGVSLENVHWISKADTETGYKDMVQTDSSVSYLHAELMPAAAEGLQAKIVELAAGRLGCPADSLDIKDGVIFSRESEEQIDVKDLLWQGDQVPILVTVSKMAPAEVTGVPFSATFAEVEVDTETGQVTVLKMVVLNDCGTVMHASGAEAQEMGGQAMGLGETLTEEIVYDEATGIPLSFNWIDYKMLTMLDYPLDMQPVLLEVWKGAGEYGACGIGEGVTTCTPRAVANAIYNALGVRIDEIPITPQKVLQALGEVRQ